MPALTKAQKTIRNVEIAALHVREWQAALGMAMQDARAERVSLRDIAKAAGVSHEQVRRMISADRS